MNRKPKINFYPNQGYEEEEEMEEEDMEVEDGIRLEEMYDE